ncbi:glycosyltransferase family 1 protein [candidate division WS5 bacterium]|uniref:Glycosyltransferase family 1 protein n=1 Tax=candidate division WS5 bacterium TaxID=2093353 RepID=A0A419DAM0_9BACT|nr:MAG: glycosyltransferase family 1 protein [candidate division WS5 bacterium]
MFTNILYVIENEFFGGGERAFAQLINGLDKGKYKVYVACLPRSSGLTPELFVEEIQGAAQIVPFDLRDQFNLWNIFRLIRIVKEKKIDFMHSQGARADFFVRIAAGLVKMPVVISTIATPVEEYNVNPVKKAVYVVLDRFGERFVDKFIVVAEHLMRKLTQIHKIPPHKVAKIYNGVDIEKYNYDPQIAVSVRKEMDIGPQVLLVGAVGRLTWEKGLPYFIEAAKKITDSGWQITDKVKYLIVGEGELEGNLRLKVKSLRLEEKVIFTGFRKDVREILGAIDILVVPSLREGFPMITLEAMAMAKPIIATNIDGITEQITDGINGILTPPKDSSAIAQAIIRLINDRESGRKLGLAARKRVEQEFSVEKMVAETEKVYLSLPRAG